MSLPSHSPAVPENPPSPPLPASVCVLVGRSSQLALCGASLCRAPPCCAFLGSRTTPVCRGCQGSGGQGSFLTDPPLVLLLRGSVFPGWPPARELLEQAWGHASSDHSKGPHSGRRFDAPFLLLGCEAGVAVRERGTPREVRLKIGAPAGSTPGSPGADAWGQLPAGCRMAEGRARGAGPRCEPRLTEGLAEDCRSP